MRREQLSVQSGGATDDSMRHRVVSLALSVLVLTAMVPGSAHAAQANIVINLQADSTVIPGAQIPLTYAGFPKHATNASGYLTLSDEVAGWFWTPLTGHSTSFTATIESSRIASGNHSLVAYVKSDLDVDYVVSQAVRVHLDTPPRLEATAFYNSSTRSIEAWINATDDDPRPLDVWLEDGDLRVNSSFNGYSMLRLYSPHGPGTYEAMVHARDRSFQTTSLRLVFVVVDDPAKFYLTYAAYDQGNMLTLAGGISDSDGPVVNLTLFVDNVPQRANVDNNSWWASFESDRQGGERTAKFASTDRFGGTTHGEFHFQTDHPAKISVDSVKREASGILLTGTAWDSDGDLVTVAVLVGDRGARASVVGVNWSAYLETTLPTGNHVGNIVTFDEYGGLTNITFSFELANSPTVFAITSSLYGAGGRLGLKGTAADPDGNVTWIGLSYLGENYNATVSNGTWQAFVDSFPHSGEHEVTLAAVDGYGGYHTEVVRFNVARETLFELTEAPAVGAATAARVPYVVDGWIRLSGSTGVTAQVAIRTTDGSTTFTCTLQGNLTTCPFITDAEHEWAMQVTWLAPIPPSSGSVLVAAIRA